MGRENLDLVTPQPQPSQLLTIHVTAGGGQMRLRFSNSFGGAALPIRARCAWPDRPASRCCAGAGTAVAVP